MSSSQLFEGIFTTSINTVHHVYLTPTCFGTGAIMLNCLTRTEIRDELSRLYIIIVESIKKMITCPCRCISRKSHTKLSNSNTCHRASLNWTRPWHSCNTRIMIWTSCLIHPTRTRCHTSVELTEIRYLLWHAGRIWCTASGNLCPGTDRHGQHTPGHASRSLEFKQLYDYSLGKSWVTSMHWCMPIRTSWTPWLIYRRKLKRLTHIVRRQHFWYDGSRFACRIGSMEKSGPRVQSSRLTWTTFSQSYETKQPGQAGFLTVSHHNTKTHNGRNISHLHKATRQPGTQ